MSYTPIMAFVCGVALGLGGCHDDGRVAAVADTAGSDIFLPDTVVDTAVDSSPDVYVEPGCTADQCDIDDRCFENGDPHPDDACQVCVVLASTASWTANDAALCDDDDACTTDDRCRDGVCGGTSVDCDDSNTCTLDMCDETDGSCTYVADKTLDPSCEDPCEGDNAPDCDDEDPCTEDRCEPFVGCVNDTVDDADSVVCDDGNSCTSGDVCVEGDCLGAARLDCDDGDLCTIDVCDADNGCVHTSIASLCTDENPCTDERCDPAQGCIFPFNTDTCNDGNACTMADTCDGGACLGLTVDPNDLNPCTDDACDPLIGVVHLANTLSCDDRDACTVGDICAGGDCQAGADPLPCNDLNGCTDDSCDTTRGCVYANNRLSCDDASACTERDRCADGVCDGAVVDCDDGNECTADSCNPASGCSNDLILINSCRPNFVITYPGRGETVRGFTGIRFINVRGSVSSGAGQIVSITVNGETPTSFDPVTGDFVHLLGVDVGGNILVIEATDSFGTVRRRVSSFLWSSAYRKPTTRKTGMVSQGVGIWLDKDAIDDGNRALPPNDLGTIFELAIGALDIAGLLPNPAATNQNAGYGIGKYTVYLENFRYDAPRVTLTPRPGGLRVRAEIRNGRVDIRAVRTGCSGPFGACVGPGTVRGDIRFNSIVILANINLSVVNNQVRATIPDSSVSLSGVDLNIDGILGGILEFIIDSFILDGLVDDIETQFNAQIATQLQPLIQDALSALAFGFDFSVPSFSGGADVPVEVITDFQAISFDADGGQFRLRSGAYVTSKVTPYDNRGIPDRVNCGSGTQTLTIPENRVLELVLADDTLNQILYAAWRGGLLEFPVPDAWLQGADLSMFGITDLDLTVSGLLAPTAGDCAGPGGLKAHIGDLKIEASLSLFGTPLDVDIWVSLIADVDIAEVDGELTIAIDAIDRVETEVVVEQPDLIAAEGAIKDLIEEQLLSGLLDTIGGQELGAIPLPDIDLSGAIPGLPAGTGIRIVPQVLYRQGGNTIVGGRLN